MSVVGWCKRIVESRAFQNTITGLILFAGVLVGIETEPQFAARYRGVLNVLDVFVLSVFAAEILLRMAAEWPRPWRYFRDPWNCFDFVIVVGALMPFIASYAMLLRLFRLLRVLRLMRALPRLRRLVEVLLLSIPSMFYVLLLVLMVFYVYACAGVFFFGATAPDHFGSLPAALFSLFQLITMEDWPDLYATVAEHAQLATAYFVSFILVGTMIMLNLVIGIIVQGMDEARFPKRQPDGSAVPLEAEIAALRTELDRLVARSTRVTEMLERAGWKRADDRGTAGNGRDAASVPGGAVLPGEAVVLEGRPEG
jgi:voltage-gated sodium channel